MVHTHKLVLTRVSRVIDVVDVLWAPQRAPFFFSSLCVTRGVRVGLWSHVRSDSGGIPCGWSTQQSSWAIVLAW
jgi:hypothetical protein